VGVRGVGGSGRVDLHLHSTVSDGLWSPTELVRQAAVAGIAILAVTDHDSTAGVGPALAAGREVGVGVLPAVEVTAWWEGQEFHVLGYGGDLNSSELQAFLAERRASRRRRVLKMLGRLRREGLPLSEEVLEAREAGASWGRAHLAAALVARGWVPNSQEAFRRYLAPGAAAYIPPEPFPPQEAIRSLRDAGAIPVLAHPVLHGVERRLVDLVEAGLQGLECYHPQHSPPVVDYFLRQARRYGLIVTGGSDSHGPDLPGFEAVEVRESETAELLRQPVLLQSLQTSPWPPPVPD
jgi:predicted metal-dependent phosphoesterase TrpH